MTIQPANNHSASQQPLVQAQVALREQQLCKARQDLEAANSQLHESDAASLQQKLLLAQLHSVQHSGWKDSSPEVCNLIFSWTSAFNVRM